MSRQGRLHNILKLALFLTMTGFAVAQTGIVDPAQLTLVQGPSDCGDSCVTVEIRLNLTGLSGIGGDAGLNGFVLTFDLDRSDAFASARVGSMPTLDWYFKPTPRDDVAMTHRLFLVGSTPDTNAPAVNYHVATLLFCHRITGDVTLTFVASESSLGSRVVSGNGPGPIAIDIGTPDPFTVMITTPFTHSFGTALTLWLSGSTDYDLASPVGPIDVLDLTKLINCGL